MPSAVVIDIGILADSGRYAVVEANAAWFGNAYAADVGRVWTSSCGRRALTATYGTATVPSYARYDGLAE